MKSVFLLLALVLSLSANSREIKFKKISVTVGPQKIQAELAETSEEHARGLMFRQELKEDHGMLFVFSDEQPRTFWMKNTFIPLSIGFFDANKKLIDIQEMQAVKSEMEANPPTYASAGPAQYALEASPGWFKKRKVKLGDLLSYK